jgi:hypothetical protein
MESQIRLSDLAGVVRKTVANVKIIDVHTHLFPFEFNSLFQSGLEDILTYHYLTSEYLSSAKEPPDLFYSHSKADQARKIWQYLFVSRSPISEAARGVVTLLMQLGIDFSEKSYEKVLVQFGEMQHNSEYVEEIFRMSNVEKLVMTNNPFDDEEWRFLCKHNWNTDMYLISIRMDDLFVARVPVEQRLQDRGYDIHFTENARCKNEFIRFLEDMARLWSPKYFSLSLGAQMLDSLLENPWFSGAFLPWLAAKKIPLALMLGVRRRINPLYRLGGDGTGEVSLNSLETLLVRFPENKIMVTTLSRGSQHRLAVLGKIFPNLYVFGFWWFVNQDSLVSEILKMRIEMLGFNFIPQHSDARVLEQLIYKWGHFKVISSDVLIEYYAKLVNCGWYLSREEIKRDIDFLFRGNAARLLNTGDTR